MDTPPDPSRTSDAESPQIPWRIALVTLGLPLCLIAVQLSLAGPELPDRVATHFDASGRPDGWMGKAAYLIVMGSVSAGIAVLFVLIAWMLPRLPTSLINMRNKDYWLAEERRTATLRSLTGNLFCHGLLALALMSWILAFIRQANTEPEPMGGAGIWVPIAIYFGATLVLIAWMFRRFRMPSGEADVAGE